MFPCPYCDHPNPTDARECGGCGAELRNVPGSVTPASGFDDEIRFLLATRGKIEAIKRFREATGAGLKEAKDAVEEVGRGGMRDASHPDRPSDEEIAALVHNGRKIEAIKIYREATGAGLKEAKDAVEAIERGQPIASPGMVSEADERELVNLLQQGQKIEAIRRYRERTGKGLKDSKEAVERLAERQGLRTRSEGGGCLGVLAVVLALVAGWIGLH